MVVNCASKWQHEFLLLAYPSWNEGYTSWFVPVLIDHVLGNVPSLQEKKSHVNQPTGWRKVIFPCCKSFVGLPFSKDVKKWVMTTAKKSLLNTKTSLPFCHLHFRISPPSLFCLKAFTNTTFLCSPLVNDNNQFLMKHYPGFKIVIDSLVKLKYLT